MEGLGEQDSIKLRIGTYNIRNTIDRYDERVDLLKKTIHDMDADILGLQEVAFGKGGQLDHLLERNDEIIFDQYNAETQLKFQEVVMLPKDFRIDGNSTIISKDFSNKKGEVLKHEILHIGGFRVGQRLLIKLNNGYKFWFVNCHLHHVIEDSHIRLAQATEILCWMKLAQHETDNVIIVGDFNAEPKEKTYSFISEFFQCKSAHLVIHGREPLKTFPTGLQAPFMDKDPEGTFDYIWYKGDLLTTLDINIVGDKAKHDDETIYPSDHYGLIATFEIGKSEFK